MNYPDKLVNLIEAFESLPTIGKKSAQRLAFYVFSELSENSVNNFSKALSEIKQLKTCSKCHCITDNDLCNICTNELRDHSTILVVENIKDVFTFENTKNYFGLYHVLNGSINFSNNIGIDELNIDTLLQRVQSEDIKEVIIATNLTTTGETTAQYLKKALSSFKCNVSRLASGVPVGADISYTDETTLRKAIEGRVIF